MSTTKRRIDTLNVIISGSIIATEHEFNLVKDEFNEVLQCSHIQPNTRRHLLQILHSTRGLDTALGTFARCHHLHVQNSALGPYLYSFTYHSIRGLGRLTEFERKHFQQKIVDKRNHFMHQAGAFPNQETVVLNILSEMQNCLSRIATL